MSFSVYGYSQGGVTYQKELFRCWNSEPIAPIVGATGWPVRSGPQLRWKKAAFETRVLKQQGCAYYGAGNRNERFFIEYARGYETQDFAHIEKHYAYPCMLTNESGTDLICDGDDLHQHVAGFLAMLKVNDLTKAVPSIEHDQHHGAKNRVVSVRWKLIGANDQTFADFGFLYVLVGGDGVWKIALANLL